MRFSSEFSREIVTETLRFQNRFASDKADQRPVFCFFFFKFFGKKFVYVNLK
jgi:hypothetical protein